MDLLLLENIFYYSMGFCMLVASLAYVRGFSTDSINAIFSFLFWFILGTIFIFGKHIPPLYVGILLVLISIITFSKKVVIGHIDSSPSETKREFAKKLGHWLIFPSVVVAFLAFFFAQFFKLNGTLSIGGASFIGIALTFLITRNKPSEILTDTSSLLRQMGPAGIIPQLLAVLGAIFTATGLGELFSQYVTEIVSADQVFLTVCIYCIAMAVFTMMIGNSFGAFSVITLAIGYPFLIAKGFSPVVVGGLGLLCGSCGTLMTPMAANFNIIPVSLLDIKNKNAVLQMQIPFAILLLPILIVSMYTFM